MDDLSFLDKKTLSLIISAMRKSFAYHSLEYQVALNKAVIRSGPRDGKRYICRVCNNVFERKMVDIDHTEPCVPVDICTSNMSLKLLYERMFTNSDKLSVLCKLCHKDKSDKEKKLRKHFRDLKKPAKITPKKKVA